MIKRKTIDALVEMGMPADIKGFGYITDVMCLFEKEGTDLKTTYVYKTIAQMNNATASNVERTIRHAFSLVLNKGNLEAVNKYLTLQSTSTSNGSLLHLLYLRLTQED